MPASDLFRRFGREPADTRAGAGPILVGTKRIASIIFCLLLLLVEGRVVAQTFLENKADAIPFNLRSYRGVPLSTTANTPVGSDGRAPSTAQQSGDNLPTTAPTAGQFQGLMPGGGGLGLASGSIGAATDFPTLATNLNMPRGRSNGVTTIFLRRSLAGSPFHGQQTTFLFGSVIPVPSFDTNLVTLVGIPKESYWLPEPYSINNHTNAGYYWSEHAQQVFAIQPGPITIVWQKATPEPAGVNLTGNTNFVSSAGGFYRLLPVRYVVSGSAVKPPKKMFWTEGIYSSVGKRISIPPARVNDVRIVYNNNFPERVDNAYQGPGEVLPAPAANLFQERRTLWFDRSLGAISAYNREGRVFVELLGDLRNGDTRHHLGFEIVDVYREDIPNDITIELGDKLKAYADGRPDAHLIPEPVPSATGLAFAYSHAPGGATRPDLYAIRETLNLNDYQVYWMQAGVAGVLWPAELARYSLVWPANSARYSHYVRPEVASEAEAIETAVALPTENAPQIDYQDPLDVPRGKLTDDFRYYTYLTPQYPAHRALLRFTQGDQIGFERVFSWLDSNLKTTNFVESVAQNLTGYNSNPALQTIIRPDNLTGARVLSQTVEVGQRINAPSGETASANGLGYLAGHIRKSAGTSYSVSAYVDPYVLGFEEAASGSIIPINSINDNGRLEVWWFRPSSANPGMKLKPVYWPSVIARYTIQWPTSPSEIILASNDGSGALGSLEASGTIYFQNDRTLPGYNPNEEHALMLGGQAYALRDDLNILSGENFSSRPFVLLQYKSSDGRPAMTAFKVLREKGDIRFDFQITAGTLVQPPMPLLALDKPLAPLLTGQPRKSLNHEENSWEISSSTRTGASLIIGTVQQPNAQVYSPLVLQRLADLATPAAGFLPTNINRASKLMSGLYSPKAPVNINYASNLPHHNLPRRKKFLVSSFADFTLNGTVSVVVPSVPTNHIGTLVATNLESGFKILLVDFGTPPASNVTNATSVLVLGNTGNVSGEFLNWHALTERIPVNYPDPATRGFTKKDRKGGVWVYRGPHNESDKPYTVQQFYYKTMAGFHFPTLSLNAQPPVGTVTPYLRAQATDGSYLGNPVYGNIVGDNQIGDGNPLPIYYRPVWPQNVPVLHMAETLGLPKRGLPAVRGQSSLMVLYQQSQLAGDGDSNRISAILHDPTREKTYNMQGATGTGLKGIPAGIEKQVYNGRTYFPNLPPHLAQRFFFDPNRGVSGALVFKGEFVDSPLGDDYYLLNVIGSQEMDALKALCPAGDLNKTNWNDVVSGLLRTGVEGFVENTSVPGTYIPASTNVFGPTELARITSDEMAVDSYALTAMGPGTGYITLMSGNGRAFTPIDDPVSMHVIKVVNTLYRGELKPILSSNPLSEKVTVQQVVDLAGQINQYEFEWRISSPVDGLPPAVYQNTRRLLMGDGVWSHVRYPVASDSALTAPTVPSSRVIQDVSNSIIPVSEFPFTVEEMSLSPAQLIVRVPEAQGGLLTQDLALVAVNAEGAPFTGVIQSIQPLSEFTGIPGDASTLRIVITGDPDQTNIPSPFLPVQIRERTSTDVTRSYVFREFDITGSPIYSQLWMSLDLHRNLGANVYLDGHLVVVANRPTDNTPQTSAPASLSPLSQTYLLEPSTFSGGIRQADGSVRHQIVVELFSAAAAGVAQTFNVRLEALEAADQTALPGTPWLTLDSTRHRDGVRAIMGEGADVRTLSDNYLIMRYRATNSTHASFASSWSQWTEPQLVEGWIKRVLAGINPFNQRVNDLFNNRVNTDVSILTQAGPRWEGDVALNLESINNFGLIEIYETVLRRGKNLSINSGINFGPANDALLLAAGYLNDLYLLMGNEAMADAANPTIGIGTKDRTYGDIATSLFAFKGQTASLLEEELALLRGRDDFLQPGVEVAPVYNRLFWNYTRGIDSGEVIYALNYNIQENNDTGVNGVINADDARKMYPQGHGDAYGHFLTAAKGYYSLLLDSDFDWVPRTEAVTVLGKAVQVDYQDERKFASAAASLARTGRQVFDLTWRQDYKPGAAAGWSHFAQTRDNTRRITPTTRYWGADHWASRTMQGAYFNWVVGNAIVPAVDPDPNHEGIQKIERGTVPELAELATLADDLQTSVDNAEGHLSPLGLPEGSITFDINPSQVTGENATPHFEQIYQRAKGALNNALASFDDAKDVTRLIRSEQDSLTELQASISRQERAYDYSLIELYGTPYPEDIGPGKTYATGYTGPDLLHFMYVDNVQLSTRAVLSPDADYLYFIDKQVTPTSFASSDKSRFNFIVKSLNSQQYDLAEGTHIRYTLNKQGFFQKPATWVGRRTSPGGLQNAIARVMLAHNSLSEAMANHMAQKYMLDRNIELFEAKINRDAELHKWDKEVAIATTTVESIVFAAKMVALGLDTFSTGLDEAAKTALESIPKSTIVGTAVGGDTFSAARASILASFGLAKAQASGINFVKQFALGAIQVSKEGFLRQRQADYFGPLERSYEDKGMVVELEGLLSDLQSSLFVINQKIQEFDDANREYQALLAKGDRILQEREVFRQRSAALIQGFRTRDAAFRIFRNEKLERYKTLFDLAARYSFLAANAYDYETGLLNTSKGRSFVNRIVNSRSLGVVRNGEPQYAGSTTGDPGLSSALAEMKADWDVLKGRLGFNNPDAYGTTVSLRTENLRILPGTEGDQNWKDVLLRGRMDNILDDSDIRRYCMQAGPVGGLPVPGIVLEFETTIADSLNLFGRPRAAGDHWYSPSAFATKIFSAGVAFEGYKGMDNPVANAAVVSGSGGVSPADPGLAFLDTQALGATPYIYLIPVGVDSMRSPPLGDESTIRSWTVEDVTVPLPFNIGASGFSTDKPWQSADSLSEQLFGIRKHQAFRPVSTTAAFSSAIYGPGGQLQRSQFTNNRLIGRSVWNSKWKLVIPGRELLNDPREGIDRFIQTVKDVKIHFVTYSYSGN